VSVCLLVGWSVAIVSRAKIVELTEMPFGVWTWVGQRNYVLDHDHHVRRGIFDE